jgi:6-phosphogluconolactonase (cycloisomerase 2 family)
MTGSSISGYQYWGTTAQLFDNQAQVGGSLYSLSANPVLRAIDPNESFLYVVCSDKTLRVFRISYPSFGQITQVSSLPLTTLPVGMTVEPTGRFLYTVDSTGVNAISVNAQTGALTSVSLSPAITVANATGIYEELAGQYLYVTAGATSVPGAVYGYAIHNDGTLTAISTAPLATPHLPTSMVFSDDIR